MNGAAAAVRPLSYAAGNDDGDAPLEGYGRKRKEAWSAASTNTAAGDRGRRKESRKATAAKKRPSEGTAKDRHARRQHVIVTTYNSTRI